MAASRLTRVGAGYMKAVKEKMKEAGKSADEVADFEKYAQAAAKGLIAKFKDLEFYTGESMDINGMYIPPPHPPRPPGAPLYSTALHPFVSPILMVSSGWHC